MTLWKRAVAFSASVLCALSAVGCGDFFVSNSTVNTVTVTPSAMLLLQGSTLGLTAQSVTVGGTTADVTSSATWTSSNTDFATVESSGGTTPGLVTAVAPCSVTNSTCPTITAASGSAKGTATVIVTSGSLPTSLTVSGSQTVAVGGTTQLRAIARLNGTDTDITSFVSWSSSSTTYATVSSSGVVTGVAACSTLIGITCPTITATITTGSGTTASGTLVFNTIS